MDLEETTQSLTTAAEMRKTTKMLMQPNANWEEYLTPGPLSIAIMGELVFISSDVKNDFSINKNAPKKGFQYIKYPDSFRACLMQICNTGWHAFNEAHKNMDQIRIHTSFVPNHMKTSVELLFNATDKVIDKLLPDHLGAISDIANECVTLAEGVEKKYSDVINLIQELLEACISAEKFYGDELENVKTKIKEAKLKRLTAERLSDRSQKAMVEVGKQVEEAQITFKEAMDKIPSGWEVVGMNLVEGLANAVTGVINGVARGISGGGGGGGGGGGSDGGSCGSGSGSEGQFEHSAEDMASQMKILSSSQEILGLIGSLTENVSGGEINWKELYDQESQSVKSEWTNTLFQGLSDRFEDMPDSQVKTKVLSLLKGGIDVCAALATYNPDPKMKWDSKKTKKVIGDLQKLNEKAQAFDTVSKRHLGLPAMSPKPPMVAKEDGKTSGHKSAGQIATDNAHFRIEQSREQLKQTREQYNKCVENMEKNEKELTEILCELQNCEIREIDFDTTIKMLVKGMDAMGRVKEQWEKMVRFFHMISNIIKASLSQTLKHFVKTAESSKTLSYDSRLFTKDLLYNQAFQASNYASLVHMISGTYTEVSSKYLMDRVSSLGKLMAMDKSNPQFMRERTMLQDSCREAQDDILKLVLKNKKEFEKNTDERMNQIEGSLKAVLPAASPGKIEKMKEIVQGAYGVKESNYY